MSCDETIQIALRYCKANEDAMRSNAFAKSLMDKDMNSFWRGITKVNNTKKYL